MAGLTRLDRTILPPVRARLGVRARQIGIADLGVRQPREPDLPSQAPISTGNIILERKLSPLALR